LIFTTILHKIFGLLKFFKSLNHFIIQAKKIEKENKQQYRMIDILYKNICFSNNTYRSCL